MKYALYSLLMILLLSGCEKKYTYVSVDENFSTQDSTHEQLIETYKEYWESFTQKDFNTSYNYEVSFERFLHTKAWYNEFNAANREGYHTTLMHIQSKEKNIVDIRSQFSYKHTSYPFNDRWYYVNGKWEHSMQTSLLPDLFK